MSQDVPVKLLFQKWRISRAVEVVSFLGTRRPPRLKDTKLGGGGYCRTGSTIGCHKKKTIRLLGPCHTPTFLSA